MPVPSLWSIGHSTHPIARFISLLSRAGVEIVCDVRGRPYSRYNPQFNRETLAGELARHGIEYRWDGDVLSSLLLGSRPLERKPDYDAMRDDPRFIERVTRLIALGAVSRVSMMCAEENPRKCHRRMLVTPALVERGVEVMHLRGDGRVEAESAIAAANPGIPQLELFC